MKRPPPSNSRLLFCFIPPQIGVTLGRTAVSRPGHPSIEFVGAFFRSFIHSFTLHLSIASDSTQWPKLSPQYCNGTRQSPININTEAVTGNENLTAFTFTNFDSAAHLKSIENTGRTGELCHLFPTLAGNT